MKDKSTRKPTTTKRKKVDITTAALRREITIDERGVVIPSSADPLRVSNADRHGIRFPILSRRPSGDTGVKENLILLRKKDDRVGDPE